MSRFTRQKPSPSFSSSSQHHNLLLLAFSSSHQDSLSPSVLPLIFPLSIIFLSPRLSSFPSSSSSSSFFLSLSRSFAFFLLLLHSALSSTTWRFILQGYTLQSLPFAIKRTTSLPYSVCFFYFFFILFSTDPQACSIIFVKRTCFRQLCLDINPIIYIEPESNISPLIP